MLALIANGRQHLPLDDVAREVRRISAKQHREALATQLEEALERAFNWERTHAAYRPPLGIRALRQFVPEIRSIASSVRDADAGLPGIALLERMLMEATPPSGMPMSTPR